MDDDMEDEIICELFTTHVHIIWRYIGITSAGIVNIIMPGPGESFKSKMLQPGPFMALMFVVVVSSMLLQSSAWFKSYVKHINHVLGVGNIVNKNSLKNFVSATISSDNVFEEFHEGIVGVYAMQGRRGNMEDRFSILQNVDVGSNKKMSFFGVYDGHGGQFVADYVKEHLFKSTIEKLQTLHADSSSKNSTPEKKENNNNNNYKPKTSNSFKNTRKSSVADDQTTNIPTTPSTPDECPDKPGFEAKTKSNPLPAGSVVNGRRPSQTQIGTNNKSKSVLNRKNSGELNEAEENKKNDRRDSDAEVNRRGSEVQDLLFGSDTKTEAASETSMKKDEAYCDINITKRHSTTTLPKDLTNNDKKEVSTDSVYFDSNKNINYTRLLTDQILAVDNKVVEHCKTCTDMSGTTAVVAVLDGEMLVIGNVGDSRAVMGDIKGMTIPLSFDHKPNQLKERRRIKEAGGFITFTGVWRVAGILATSRALGDFPLKDPRRLITAEPDVLTFSLREHKAQFVILATDGLWDVMSNEEAVRYIRDHITEDDYGARSLALHAYQLGSLDNITITVLNLSKLSL